ncbi:FGGY family carbohydrate kinase [Streptomyces iconiensis]|uniref:FGGY-family carbohydrate kinase n=1 Tax=Streptomyces iconiensis TaxID=1384038 RepID=A0ABT7A6Z2_9ACTN|nr:FGGY-family carbohydrate kinase [Streptomyces iconiensis]MDJ1137076.1 FGGY-family carbohydrate kinase [Streptomyces iconiensis]
MTEHCGALIGVDIGTSVTKAVAFDRDGRALHTAARPSTLLRGPGGVVEQDLDEVLRSVAEVVREVAAALPGPPTALALTGQGDGLWLRDAGGRPARRMISWMDGRAAGLVARWQRDGTVREVFGHTGSGMFPGCHAPLLAWLRAYEPETLERAAVAGYCVDAVAQRLTGTVSVDASDATLPFLDPATRSYSPGALAACGVGDLAHLLPEPAAPRAVLALDRAGAELLGLAEGLPLTSGPYDLPACAVGSGVREVGDGLLTVGTTLACQVLTDRTDAKPGGDPAGMWLCTPDRDRWLRAMPAMVGTAGIDWTLHLVGATTAELEPLLAQSPPGARGVSALPFLSEAGERAPFVAPGARAGFEGLSLAHGSADVVRAMCEAVGYAARHCLETAGLEGTLAACGGGTRSEGWMRTFAGILGRPVRVPEETEVGAKGAAIVARAALGDPVDEERWHAAHRLVEPDPDDLALYESGYARYRETVESSRAHWEDPVPAQA